MFISHRSQSRQYEANSLLNMPSCTPTPSEMLIPELYLADQAGLSAASIIECEIASRNNIRKIEPIELKLNVQMIEFCCCSKVVIQNQQLCIPGEAAKFF